MEKPQDIKLEESRILVDIESTSCGLEVPHYIISKLKKLSKRVNGCMKLKG